MALIDQFHADDMAGPTTGLGGDLFTAGLWSEKPLIKTDASGRWNYRASVLFVVASSLALWACMFEAYRLIF